MENGSTAHRIRKILLEDVFIQTGFKFKNQILPLRRIGKPSTDGAAFVLNDERYVGKFIFYNTEANYMKSKEYEIAKQMGDAHIGPKVYEKYDMEMTFFNSQIIRNLIGRNMRREGGVIQFIVMENVGYGAKKLQTLYEYLKDKNPYPTRQVHGLLNRMESFKIIHGDLHQNNILVKTLPNNKIKVYFIDFGRSIPYTNIHHKMKGPKLVKNKRYVLSPIGRTYRAFNRNMVPPKNNITQQNLNATNLFNNPKFTQENINKILNKYSGTNKANATKRIYELINMRRKNSKYNPRDLEYNVNEYMTTLKRLKYI